MLVFLEIDKIYKTIKKNEKCYPCYSSGNAVKPTLNFGLIIQLENDTIIDMNNITSHKFSQFLMKHPFPGMMSYNEWDHTSKFINLILYIKNIIEYVNITVEWSKRGKINDQSAIGEDQKIQSTDINHHVATMFVTALYRDDKEEFLAILEQQKVNTTENSQQFLMIFELFT